MSELDEAAISREPEIDNADLEKKLTRIAEFLSTYRGEGVDEDIEAFAQAEVTEDDPLR